VSLCVFLFLFLQGPCDKGVCRWSCFHFETKKKRVECCLLDSHAAMQERVTHVFQVSDEMVLWLKERIEHSGNATMPEFVETFKYSHREDADQGFSALISKGFLRKATRHTLRSSYEVWKRNEGDQRGILDSLFSRPMIQGPSKYPPSKMIQVPSRGCMSCNWISVGSGNWGDHSLRVSLVPPAKDLLQAHCVGDH
jgi:hypothetical protein